MSAVRIIATAVDLLVTLAAIVIGLVILVTPIDGPWWLLPFGLVYLLTFGAAGRALWAWLGTPGR